GESYLQILLDKPLFDPNHGAATHGEGLGNPAISCLWLALTLVAHQQHARHQILLCWGSARMHHRFQKPSLLFTQFHGVAVSIGSHPWTPCFVGESCSVEKPLSFRFALAVNVERNRAESSLTSRLAAFSTSWERSSPPREVGKKEEHISSLFP